MRIGGSWVVRTLVAAGISWLGLALLSPAAAFALQSKFTGSQPVTLKGQKAPPAPKAAPVPKGTKTGAAAAGDATGLLDSLMGETSGAPAAPKAGKKGAKAAPAPSVKPAAPVSTGEPADPSLPLTSGEPSGELSGEPSGEPLPVAAPPPVAASGWVGSYDEAKAAGLPCLIVVLDKSGSQKQDDQAVKKEETGGGSALAADDVDKLQKEMEDIEAKMKAQVQANRTDRAKDPAARKASQDKMREYQVQMRDLRAKLRGAGKAGKMKKGGNVHTADNTNKKQWGIQESLVLDVLSNPGLVAALTGCVGAVVDVSAAGAGKPIADQLGVKMLPTYLFFGTDGSEFQRLEGDSYRPEFVISILEELKTTFNVQGADVNAGGL